MTSSYVAATSQSANPWKGHIARLRKEEDPLMGAIHASGVAETYAGRPITEGMLAEISDILTKATGSPCTAFHEVAMVPAADGMVRAHIITVFGQTWTVTVFRSPQHEESTP